MPLDCFCTSAYISGHMKTLGERIRELREAKDMSLRELAQVLGVSAAFMSDVELGRRYPSDAILERIAKQLGTTKDELATYDTRPPISEIKRRASADPVFGVALRRMIDSDVDPEEFLRWLDEQEARKEKL